jgi:hypothetical protein
MADRQVQALAADATSLTISELRRFLAEVGDVPDDAAGIRVVTSARGGIESISAFFPRPDDSAGAELPGDVLRDLAAVLQSQASGDHLGAITVFSNSDMDTRWALVMLLAEECLALARKVHGGDLAPWIARFRKAANAIDADEAGG